MEVLGSLGWIRVRKMCSSTCTTGRMILLPVLASVASFSLHVCISSCNAIQLSMTASQQMGRAGRGKVDMHADFSHTMHAMHRMRKLFGQEKAKTRSSD